MSTEYVQSDKDGENVVWRDKTQSWFFEDVRTLDTITFYDEDNFQKMWNCLQKMICRAKFGVLTFTKKDDFERSLDPVKKKHMNKSI